jgi:hypothetical protein
MADQERMRFEQVAKDFSHELWRIGLRPIGLKITDTPAQDGWCAEIAVWAKHRPNVSVWFDKWLETPERHFWFGFEGPKAKMEVLYEAIKASYGNGKVPVIYNNSRFENSRESAFDIVKANAGFVYEKYRGGTYYLGTYDIGFNSSSERDLVEQAAKFILSVVQDIEPLKEADIEELNRRKNLSATDRQALISARRGQGQFRRDLEKIWNARCAVTGCTVTQVLRASHIKPWKDAEDEERLDGNNGLLLTATLDGLFNSGLISFDDQGAIQIASSVSPADRQLLMLDGMKLSKPPSNGQREYLKIHRRRLTAELA